MALIDYRGAVAAASDDLIHNDNAQLLVTTALATDGGTALDAAVDALGHDGLAAALPFVQLPALTLDQVAAVRAAGLDLDELRAGAAERAAVEAPQLMRMRRVTGRSLLQVALLVGAFIAIAAVVGALDVGQVVKELETATWWLVVAALLIGQVPRFTQAVSVLSASPLPLPLGPTYALQLATSYITLAIPTTAARVAVNVRFLQRHGLTATTALAVGGVDAIVEFLVQVLLVLGLVVLTPASLHIDLGASAPSALTTLIWIVVGVAVAAVLVVAVVGRLRRLVVTWTVRMWHSAMTVVRELRSPRRVGSLIGANVASEVLLAFTLQTFARALGYNVGIRGSAADHRERAGSGRHRPHTRRYRRRGRWSGVRVGARRAAGRGRLRGGRALPSRHVLSAAGVGVLRVAMAGTQQASVGVHPVRWMSVTTTTYTAATTTIPAMRTRGCVSTPAARRRRDRALTAAIASAVNSAIRMHAPTRLARAIAAGIANARSAAMPARRQLMVNGSYPGRLWVALAGGSPGEPTWMLR